MASKKLSSDTSLANSYKLSRGVASVARPSAPTIGTATDTNSGAMSVTFTASTLGPTASSFTLTSSSGVTASGASSPLTLQELAVGTYTYTVYGTNANGNGPSSAASNSVVVSSVYAASFESITTTTVGAGGAGSITISSIPSTYTHLQLRYTALTSRATYGIDGLYLTFNGVGSSVYSRHDIRGDGGAISAGSASTAGYIDFNYATVGTTVTNYPGAGVIDILDYTNTNKLKTVRALAGVDVNGTVAGFGGAMQIVSGLYQQTTAISSLTITPQQASFAQYSSFALYGIKVAA